MQSHFSEREERCIKVYMLHVLYTIRTSFGDAAKGAVQPQFINKEMSERLGSGERG